MIFVTHSKLREALDNFRKTTVRIVVYVGVRAHLTASEWSGLVDSLDLPHLPDRLDSQDIASPSGHVGACVLPGAAAPAGPGGLDGMAGPTQPCPTLLGLLDSSDLRDDRASLLTDHRMSGLPIRAK